MKQRLWWLGTLLLVVASWLGMEQLTWMQELRPGLDSLVRFTFSTAVFAVASTLNPFKEESGKVTPTS